jgi:hypothetical protein
MGSFQVRLFFILVVLQSIQRKDDMRDLSPDILAGMV